MITLSYLLSSVSGSSNFCTEEWNTNAISRSTSIDGEVKSLNAFPWTLSLGVEIISLSQDERDDWIIFLDTYNGYPVTLTRATAQGAVLETWTGFAKSPFKTTYSGGCSWSIAFTFEGTK